MLHYAADANMFEYLSPPTTFFSSIDNYCKVEQLTNKFKREPLSTMNRKVQQNPIDPQPYLNVGKKTCILILQQVWKSDLVVDPLTRVESTRAPFLRCHCNCQDWNVILMMEEKSPCVTRRKILYFCVAYA